MAKRKTEPQGRNPFNRRAARMELQPSVLIVCEGGKTEVQYLNSLKRELRLAAVEIHGRGASPASLVRFALRKNKGPNPPYDHVWCVFDRNGHEDFTEGIKLARAHGFKTAFSNPCFELWYLLHYENQKAALNSKDALKKLKQLVPGYKKSMDIYDRIRGRQKDAVKHSQQLRKMHKANHTPHPADQNPATDVDRLVLFLNGITPQLP